MTTMRQPALVALTPTEALRLLRLATPTGPADVELLEHLARLISRAIPTTQENP